MEVVADYNTMPEAGFFGFSAFAVSRDSLFVLSLRARARAAKKWELFVLRVETFELEARAETSAECHQPEMKEGSKKTSTNQGHI